MPFLWANGGRNIVWNADLGDLGDLPKAQADALVGDSFGQWQNVASSTISYVKGANLPVDVDETNFLAYYEATAPDGLSAIVYDDSGAIFELLFGEDSGVLGFAGPEFADPATCTITEGLAFLNGPEFTPADLGAGFSIMVHEFGHFSNLAHTQTNGGILLGTRRGDSRAQRSGAVQHLRCSDRRATSSTTACSRPCIRSSSAASSARKPRRSTT